MIATATFGNVADANVGNLLLRLPGITAQRDEGEVHNVSLRGVDPQFSSVMVDGTRLSGASTRGNGLSRAFEVDKVSTNSIESIEVIGNGADTGFDGLYGGYTLTTRVNGGWARVRRLDVFVDATNVFNDKSNTFQGRGDRPTDSQIYGVRMAAGASGAF